MGKLEPWLVAAIWVGTATLLPMAALEPASLVAARASARPLAPAACVDGSAHLAMGCASISL
ncbi:MAG TPA: hypothetical protein VFZ91_16485 [Allosphingosinicella sp.]